MEKRIVPNLYIAIQDGAKFEAIQENAQIQDIIFTNIISGIEHATKHNRKEATIVELNSTGNYISIPQSNWKQSLETAQQYFIKQEKYETCATIQKIIESINSYGSKSVHRKTSRANKPNNRNRKYTKTSKKDN